MLHILLPPLLYALFFLRGLRPNKSDTKWLSVKGGKEMMENDAPYVRTPNAPWKMSINLYNGTPEATDFFSRPMPYYFKDTDKLSSLWSSGSIDYDNFLVSKNTLVYLNRTTDSNGRGTPTLSILNLAEEQRQATAVTLSSGTVTYNFMHNYFCGLLPDGNIVVCKRNGAIIINTETAQITEEISWANTLDLPSDSYVGVGRKILIDGHRIVYIHKTTTSLYVDGVKRSSAVSHFDNNGAPLTSYKIDGDILYTLTTARNSSNQETRYLYKYSLGTLGDTAGVSLIGSFELSRINYANNYAAVSLLFDGDFAYILGPGYEPSNSSVYATIIYKIKLSTMSLVQLKAITVAKYPYSVINYTIVSGQDDNFIYYVGTEYDKYWGNWSDASTYAINKISKSDLNSIETISTFNNGSFNLRQMISFTTNTKQYWTLRKNHPGEINFVNIIEDDKFFTLSEAVVSKDFRLSIFPIVGTDICKIMYNPDKKNIIIVHLYSFNVRVSFLAVKLGTDTYGILTEEPWKDW